jgi:hypothetical protein
MDPWLGCVGTGAHHAAGTASGVGAGHGRKTVLAIRTAFVRLAPQDKAHDRKAGQEPILTLHRRACIAGEGRPLFYTGRNAQKLLNYNGILTTQFHP